MRTVQSQDGSQTARVSSLRRRSRTSASASLSTTERLRAARQKGDPEAETLAIKYDVLKTTFKDLFSKIEESRLAVALQQRQIGETLRLIDPARVPERPISPDHRIYAAIGAATGFAAGLLLFFVWPRGLFRKKRPGVVVPAEA